MKHPDYNSPAELKNVLDANGFSMQKKFGQNFLINEDARRRLVDALELTEGMKVWEVGPGLGAMTNTILERGADLTVFEIDRGFASLISGFFEDYTKGDTFRIVEGDVMKTWTDSLETFLTILLQLLLQIQSKTMFVLINVYLQFRRKLLSVCVQNQELQIILLSQHSVSGLMMLSHFWI